MAHVGVAPPAFDWRLTVAGIDQEGSEIERARLRGILGRPRPDIKIVRGIEARQNEDGGAPHGMVSGRLSTIDATTTMLEWLMDLRLAESAGADRACTYLLSAQRPDGAWDEPPGLLRYAPPPRLVPGDPRVRCRATARVAFWLARLGYRDDAPRRAVAYVAARQAADGRVLGFLEATWCVTAASCLLDGAESDVAVRGLQSLAAVPEERWGAGALAGMIYVLGEAGLTPSLAVVARGLDRLRALVRPDGTWLSGDGEAYHIEASLAALRALVFYGAIAAPRAADAAAPPQADPAAGMRRPQTMPEGSAG